jgi:hypothetical protein
MLTLGLEADLRIVRSVIAFLANYCKNLDESAGSEIMQNPAWLALVTRVFDLREVQLMKQAVLILGSHIVSTDLSGLVEIASQNFIDDVIEIAITSTGEPWGPVALSVIGYLTLALESAGSKVMIERIAQSELLQKDLEWNEEEQLQVSAIEAIINRAAPDYFQ